MEYIEYPKSLYRNGEELVVNDSQQDADAVKDGWTDWNSDYNRAEQDQAEHEEDQAEEGKAKRKYTRRATAG